MGKTLLIGIAIATVIGGYFLFSSKQQSNTSMPATITQDSASPSAAMNDVTVTLLEQNDSGESGTVTLTEVDGKVKVTVKTTGGPTDVSQPAHIHVGACPEVGAVKYPLTNVMNGTSETTLDVTLDQLRSELPLGINVHKSVPEAKIYTSCGDLTL